MSRVLTGSGRPYLTNVQMLGGIELDANAGFTNLPLASGSNFAQGLSSSFAASSGSVIQSMNYLKSQIDSLSSGQDFDATGSAGTTQSTILASETFAFATGSAAGVSVALFDSGAGGGVNIAADLNTLAAAAVADGDFIAIIDADDSNITKKEAIADVATLFAGAGMTATNSVMNVIAGTNGGLSVAANDISLDLNDLSAAAVNMANDSIAIVDADDNSSKKESIADFVNALVGGADPTSGIDDNGSGVIILDIVGMGAEATTADAQILAVDTGADGTLKKMTRGNLLGSAKAIFTSGVSIADEFTATANLSSSVSISAVGMITSIGGMSTSGSFGAGGSVLAGTNVAAGQGGAHSYVSGTELRLHGTNAAGVNKSFALSVSGGMLQVNAAT